MSRLRSLALVAACALLPARAQAAMTCASANFSAVSIDTSTVSASKTVTIPTDVPAGAVLIAGILNRTDESTTLTSVSDPVNGAWGAAVGPVDSAGATFRTWMAYKVNSAALTGAGNRLVTVTTSGGVSTQIVAGWCSDGAGANTFDTSSAALHNDAVNDTNHDTGTLAAAGAGGIVGCAGANNALTSYTMDGAGESQLTGVAAGQRISCFFEATGGAGNYGFEITSNPTLANSFLIASFLTPSAGGGGRVQRGTLIGVW